VRHALLLPFPELAPIVDRWLEHSVGSRPSDGIPPHVTILAPSPPDIGDVLGGVEAFDVEFREMRRFPIGAVWLAPDPSEPFVALTKRVWERYPDWPPYGGEFLPDITPHLTVAWGAKLDEAEADLRTKLPLHGRAREARLFRRVDETRWVVQSTFPFI
jgi:2'-5' RNA ligase superfamily